MDVDRARSESLDDRNGEAQRLAGSGRSLGEDVPSGERVAKDVRLDREGCVDVTLGE